MKKLFSTLAVCSGLMFVPLAAHAALVVWTLDGVVFDDGSTASGSFTFDAATTTFSSLSISTTSGASYELADLAGSVFGADANGVNVVDGYLFGGDNTGRAILNLDFVSSLTDAGGIVSIVTGFPSFEGVCGTMDCTSGSVSRFTIAGGRVIGAPVAVSSPGALSMLALGLAALALTRRSAR